MTAMGRHLIVVDRVEDFPWSLPNCRVVAVRDYVREAAPARPASARVFNLCRDHSYLSLGYYCSLLAEGRGHKTIPSIEVMLDLHWKRLLRIALPEVNELVRKTFNAPPRATKISAHIFFRQTEDARLAEAARRIFDLFRCPLLKLTLQHRGSGWEIADIGPAALRDLSASQKELFRDALERHVRVGWPRPKETTPARYAIAILHDPAETMPPSNPKALEKFVAAGAQAGVEVDLITKADYGRLLEYDALFIRETTALDNHTYRFAKKADSEDLVVIDDPRSILRCTNKIFLAELLQANGVPTPRTLIVGPRDEGRIESELGYPAVLKVPDGSFSRGVLKVADRTELDSVFARLLDASDLIIAQQFMPTEYDWRVGVLDRQPLYVCQYMMARGHWQVVKHEDGGRFTEGRFRTLALDEAPKEVIDVAVRAASLIGDGLYGVDLKQTEAGVFVVEINDNPNIDSGIEDAVLRDTLYAHIIAHFVDRLDRRAQPQARAGRTGGRAPDEPAKPPKRAGPALSGNAGRGTRR